MKPHNHVDCCVGHNLDYATKSLPGQILNHEIPALHDTLPSADDDNPPKAKVKKQLIVNLGFEQKHVSACCAGHSLDYAMDFLQTRLHTSNLPSLLDTWPLADNNSVRAKVKKQLTESEGAFQKDVSVKLHDAGGQKARVATPVSSPTSQQFNIVAQAIYDTVQPPQVCDKACLIS